MLSVPNEQLLQVETTCGTLLYELKIIWDEVGEPDDERDRMLHELEQECLEVYRRKVDQANRSRAQLRQAIADSEAELAAICSAMGERPVHIRQSDQNAGSLKEELRIVVPQLEEMHKRKCERKNQFLEVQDKIQKISDEIYTTTEYNASKIVLDETDLSLKKLEELHRHLEALQKEKSDRLNQVLDHLNTLNSLCLVLGMDFKHAITNVHPSLDDSEGGKNISNETIERLVSAIHKLREVKIQRMQKLQDLATTMLELWNLMDTPIEEQQIFQNVTCNIAASEHEITEPNTLSVDFINYVEAEVSRLEELKASKMKELVLKKRSELEDICRRTHMIAEADSAMEYAIEAIESGAVDPSCILEQIELRIATVKDEAFSRKEILDKVEKWLATCEEECWLEEYNRDENRYNAGRGAHLTLKRAEKARTAVNKLPAMVEALASKTKAWEKEKGMEFIYDGVPLLSMLEEDSALRQEKEQERRRQRDQKKLQGQLIAEQEAIFGSKPSPSKPQSAKKVPRTSTGGPGSKRCSVGTAMPQTPRADLIHSAKPTLRPSSRKGDRALTQDDGLSAVRRGLDIAGLSQKKHSFNSSNAREAESPMARRPTTSSSAREPETPTARRPFSPVSTNMTEDFNKPQNGPLPKTLSFNNAELSTPSRTSCDADEENRTPRAMPIPVPNTPTTISVPMQTATTPAPTAPSVTNLVGSKLDMPEEIEYSFEERRAGFVLGKHIEFSVLQI